MDHLGRHDFEPITGLGKAPQQAQCHSEERHENACHTARYSLDSDSEESLSFQARRRIYGGLNMATSKRAWRFKLLLTTCTWGGLFRGTATSGSLPSCIS